MKSHAKKLSLRILNAGDSSSFEAFPGDGNKERSKIKIREIVQ